METPKKLPPQQHLDHPWRIREIAPDFRLEDAWSLPVEGGPGDFPELQRVFVQTLEGLAGRGPSPTRFLFALRDRLGRWLGWDEHVNALPIPGCQELSLRERLPADLPASDLALAGELPFRPVFATDREYVAELANGTAHAVLQLGWVRAQGDTYRGRLGVYVKPRGRLGPFYMALIAPFRHYIVYPALLRAVGRAWAARGQG